MTEPINLPAPLGDATGGLDVDTLRKLSPQVRAGLVEAIRAAAAQARTARGTVVVPEDTYPLVRRLTDAGEVLRQWRDAFEAAAKECDALTEEEALTAMGEQDGVPNASLFVPDGEGHRIAVRADYSPGEMTWDTTTLTEWLVDDEVAERSADLAQDETPWDAGHAREVASNVAWRLLELGRYTPSARAVEALRKRLAERQRDADAAVLRQVRSVGPRRYRGVKITREEA